jgi:hypothetical protein
VWLLFKYRLPIEIRTFILTFVIRIIPEAVPALYMMFLAVQR